MDNGKRKTISDFLSSYKDEFGPVPRWNLSNTRNKLLYNTPFIDDEEIVSFIDTYLNGRWVAGGEKVAEFEKEYCKLVGNDYSVAVSSGSSGDLLMVAAAKEYFGWNKGNEECVISAVGFPTTYSGLMINNIKPVLVDIELNSLNFDLDKIEEKITKNTVAILNSPVLGNTANIDRLLEICDKHGLKLLQDNADSLGTKWRGKELTEYALISNCSLYVAHHITFSGHGGIVSSNNRGMMDILRCMSKWGSLCTCPSGLSACPQGICGRRFSNWLEGEPDLTVDHRYVYGYLGYNVQVPLDAQGAFGLEQIKKFPVIHRKRVENKRKVEELFRKYIPEVKHPTNLPECEPSWFGTPIHCPNKSFKTNLVSYLERNNVQTRNCFAGLISLHRPYAHLGVKSEFLNAQRVLEEVFFVGANPNWNAEQFEYLEETLKNFKIN